MRFLPNGPDIPDELLEAHEDGKVVFLCGAGISFSAGMPDFPELAKYVVEKLRVSPEERVRDLLSYWCDSEHPSIARPPLDEIFNLLQQEYNASDVDYFIAERLKTKCGTSVSEHQTILKLSKEGDGKARLVTTNFDHLFEVAEPSILTCAPPALPDLGTGQILDGIVYLHGRINPTIGRGEERQNLVVSSSDFGRAYLVEGWARDFLRELLNRYIVVLLGYSASDPPVKYLLQGLHSMNLKGRNTIYAFAGGCEREVQELWKDRGVTPLPYPIECGDHSALWHTLEAWAQRADNPLAWQRQVIEIARKGPRVLDKYERGQVATLVSTYDGARLFADADPPPPGEWLCVFDSTIRYGKVKQDVYGLLPDFDPQVDYGLADDPPKPRGNRSEAVPPGDDFLSVRASDSRSDDKLRLAGMPRLENFPLPPRLFRLALWIVKIAHEPVALWWAAQHTSLHQFLLKRIELRMRQSDEDFPSLARSIWNLLFEKFGTAFDDDDPSLFEVDRRIKIEGWTNSVLRAFERSVTPHVKTELRPSLNAGRPPEKNWAELKLSDIAKFDVGFPSINDIQSQIPDEVLPAIYRIGGKQLELAVGMLTEIQPTFWRNLTLYPRNQESVMRGNDPGAFLLWFRALLDRMSEIYPDLVRADTALWPREDRYFFNMLLLYAWSFGNVFTGDEVGTELLSLSRKTFWDTLHRRELLHLMRRRWQDLPMERRRQLEQQIVQGPPKWRDESEEEHRRHRSLVSATILGWLLIQDCDLSDDTLDALPRLRDANPDWFSDMDEGADDFLGAVEGGWISSKKDPSVLLNVPISEVIPLAQESTVRSYEDMTDHQPFDGLVEQHIGRAIAALNFAGEQGEYPREFWHSLLENWPETANHRLIGLVGEKLVQLPSEVIEKSLFQVFYWLEKNLPELAKHDPTRAFDIFDASLEELFIGGEDATRSGIDQVSVAGDNQGWSRRTMDHAFNSTVGLATQLLFDILKSQSPEKGAGIPSEIKTRVELLVEAPGEGADHAICLVAHQVEWLHYLDPDWTSRTIVPWFDPEHHCSEPAWNGFLHKNKLPQPKMFSLIRAYFLQVFRYARNWKWNDQGYRVLHEFLVCGGFWRRHDEAYLTYTEVHRALQQTDDSGRAQSIEYLTDLIERNHASWDQFGKPFLDEAWPKENRLQTEDTSLNLARLAGVTGNNFPEAVQAILPWLVPIYGDSWFLYRVVSRGGEEEFELAMRFPEETLMLMHKLVPDNPPERPFDLDNLLERLAEAKPTLRQDRRWRRLKKIARLE